MALVVNLLPLLNYAVQSEYSSILLFKIELHAAIIYYLSFMSKETNNNKNVINNCLICVTEMLLRA